MQEFSDLLRMKNLKLARVIHTSPHPTLVGQWMPSERIRRERAFDNAREEKSIHIKVFAQDTAGVLKDEIRTRRKKKKGK